MPQLHVVAGPNGSGKSTFVREVRNGRLALAFAIPRVINPDEIAVAMNALDPDAAAAAAGREALVQREVALARRETFAIETTLSGNSERRLISDAKALGYLVTMTYIALDNRDRNVVRVEQRAAVERRTVPPETVQRRYERSLANLAEVADSLDRLDVYDNSEERFRPLLTLERGRVVTTAPNLPAWTRRALRIQLERNHGLER
ncbi:MAG: zeta toxin family protein [Vulcanimicrobiaceae bacterium]